ncbi:MAG: Ig-like domain-containing protein, partial [Bacteroidota bacterium]
MLELVSVRIGTDNLEIEASSHSFGVPIDQPIIATFAEPLDRSSVAQSFRLVQDRDTLALTFNYLDEDKTVSFKPNDNLGNKKLYQLLIKKGLKGTTGSEFPGISLGFETKPGVLLIQSFAISGVNAQGTQLLQDLPINFQAEIVFSAPLTTDAISGQPVTLVQPGGSVPLQFSWSDQNTKLTVSASAPLKDLTRHSLVFNPAIIGNQGEVFQPLTRVFYTQLDPQPKFPQLSDEDLLTLVQQQTFKYFWDFAHPASGMARERNTSGDLVTSGGSGFGIMALIVGMERGFITRQQGIERMNKIVGFLETADRFHGAWPHWMNGNTGDVIPFSTKDNGGDLVETSFLVQGLITFRQYLNANDPQEKTLIDRINILWEGVEWSWYRKNNENVLYWHWSPTYNWEMNFAMYGYFEQQITYFLAAASPTYGIPKEVYTNGFGRNGAIKTGNVYYGITLPLATPSPLFWV